MKKIFVFMAMLSFGALSWAQVTPAPVPANAPVTGQAGSTVTTGKYYFDAPVCYGKIMFDGNLYHADVYPLNAKDIQSKYSNMTDFLCEMFASGWKVQTMSSYVSDGFFFTAFFVFVRV